MHFTQWYLHQIPTQVSIVQIHWFYQVQRINVRFQVPTVARMKMTVCLLLCCSLESGRSLLMFQRCLLPPLQGNGIGKLLPDCTEQNPRRQSSPKDQCFIAYYWYICLCKQFKCILFITISIKYANKYTHCWD
jgi:hypothetical protein